MKITSTGQGKNDVIVFQNMEEYFLQEQLQHRKSKDSAEEKDKMKQRMNEDAGEEKEKMIGMLGKIINAEIRAMDRPDMYPTADQLHNEESLTSWLPPSLLSILAKIIPNPLNWPCFSVSCLQPITFTSSHWSWSPA